MTIALLASSISFATVQGLVCDSNGKRVQVHLTNNKISIYDGVTSLEEEDFSVEENAKILPMLEGGTVGALFSENRPPLTVVTNGCPDCSTLTFERDGGIAEASKMDPRFEKIKFSSTGFYNAEFKNCSIWVTN